MAVAAGVHTASPILCDGFGSCWGDYDLDGDLDPYVTGWRFSPPSMGNRLFRNEGNGTFTDRTTTSGTGLDNNGMGSAIGDPNNDGHLDWFVTAIWGSTVPLHTGNKLYLNLDNELFFETAALAGVADGGWGWGTALVDLDHDGDEDIVETNGWEHQAEFVGENAYVYINEGGVRLRPGR